MPKVRNAGNAGNKWSQNAQNATGDYTSGVQNPRTEWQAATLAAHQAWKDGVTKAVTDGRFQKGVSKVAANKQQMNALSKGAPRFAQGVAVGQQDYTEGVAPFLRIIESTQLPPRGPKGDVNNIKRVGTMAAALHAGKVGK